MNEFDHRLRRTRSKTWLYKKKYFAKDGIEPSSLGIQGEHSTTKLRRINYKLWQAISIKLG